MIVDRFSRNAEYYYSDCDRDDREDREDQRFFCAFVHFIYYIPKKNESKKYVGRVRMNAIIENINRVTDEIFIVLWG